MLVLSRKIGEKISIGDNIEVTVVKIDRGKCRIGIQAPKSVSIARAELLVDVPHEATDLELEPVLSLE